MSNTSNWTNSLYIIMIDDRVWLVSHGHKMPGCDISGYDCGIDM